MNRSFESGGANGIDREGESHEPRESRDLRDDWGRRGADLERGQEARYGYQRRQDSPYGSGERSYGGERPYGGAGGARTYGGERPYGGFIGDHERFSQDDRDRDRLDPQRLREMQRARFWDEREHYVPGGQLPPPAPLPPREVWRGRNEDYDFWGRERHPHGMHGEEHPSLWQRVKGAFTGKGPKGYVRSDERIREDVCEHLSYHPYIDASDIEVTVREGEVTLSGTVDGRMVKRAAEECCDHVRGVKDVHNHLRVRPQTEQQAR
jgi:hypothetical protein